MPKIGSPLQLDVRTPVQEQVFVPGDISLTQANLDAQVLPRINPNVTEALAQGTQKVNKEFGNLVIAGLNAGKVTADLNRQERNNVLESDWADMDTKARQGFLTAITAAEKSAVVDTYQANILKFQNRFKEENPYATPKQRREMLKLATASNGHVGVFTAKATMTKYTEVKTDIEAKLRRNLKDAGSKPNIDPKLTLDVGVGFLEELNNMGAYTPEQFINAKNKYIESFTLARAVLLARDAAEIHSQDPSKIPSTEELLRDLPLNIGLKMTDENTKLALAAYFETYAKRMVQYNARDTLVENRDKARFGHRNKKMLLEVELAIGDGSYTEKMYQDHHAIFTTSGSDMALIALKRIHTDYLKNKTTPQPLKDFWQNGDGRDLVDGEYFNNGVYDLDGIEKLLNTRKGEGSTTSVLDKNWVLLSFKKLNKQSIKDTLHRSHVMRIIGSFMHELTTAQKDRLSVALNVPLRQLTFQTAVKSPNETRAVWFKNLVSSSDALANVISNVRGEEIEKWKKGDEHYAEKYLDDDLFADYQSTSVKTLFHSMLTARFGLDKPVEKGDVKIEGWDDTYTVAGNLHQFQQYKDVQIGNGNMPTENDQQAVKLVEHMEQNTKGIAHKLGVNWETLTLAKTNMDEYTHLLDKQKELKKKDEWLDNQRFQKREKFITARVEAGDKVDSAMRSAEKMDYWWRIEEMTKRLASAVSEYVSPSVENTAEALYNRFQEFRYDQRMEAKWKELGVKPPPKGSEYIQRDDIPASVQAVSQQVATEIIGFVDWNKGVVDFVGEQGTSYEFEGIGDTGTPLTEESVVGDVQDIVNAIAPVVEEIVDVDLGGYTGEPDTSISADRSYEAPPPLPLPVATDSAEEASKPPDVLDLIRSFSKMEAGKTGAQNWEVIRQEPGVSEFISSSIGNVKGLFEAIKNKELDASKPLADNIKVIQKYSKADKGGPDENSSDVDGGGGSAPKAVGGGIDINKLSQEAAEKIGVDQKDLLAIFAIESSSGTDLKSSTSSAEGIGQILDATALSLSKHPEFVKLGATPKQIQTDPLLGAYGTALLFREALERYEDVGKDQKLFAFADQYIGAVEIRKARALSKKPNSWADVSKYISNRVIKEPSPLTYRQGAKNFMAKILKHLKQ